MAIANVNQITATLRMMSDPQLQQYAMMHKNDPYILPMAISESNSRKQVRAQGQAQGMGQPQPKVADANIAGMLPEDQGIGALPAPNMARMADGGIAGYADGGMDEQGTYNSEPVIRMAEGGVARYQSGGLAERYKAESIEMGMGTRMQYSPEVQAFARAEEEASKSGYAERERQKMLRGPYGPDPVASKPVIPTLNQATMPAAGYTRTDPRAAGTMPSAADQMAQSAVYAAKAAAPPPGPRPAPFAAAPAAPTPAAPAAPAQSTAERYMAMQNATGGQDRAEIDRQQTELEEKIKQAALDRDAAKEREIAERGKYGEAKETRLTKREEALGKEKDQMSGLALIEAGLGIMSTPGTLAVAIGKGAKEGLKSYGEGLAKLKMAQERIDDARDQIEENRRNEANMTAKERRESADDISKAELEAKKLGLAAAREMYGFHRDDTKTVFTADTQERLTGQEITSREKISANEIAARKALSASDNAARERIAQLPQGNERIAMLLGEGNLAKGLAKFAEIQAGKFNPTTAYTDYISKRKEGDTVLTPQEFVTQIRSIQALMSGAPTVSNKPTGKAFE
jgi:hypothetical protein